MTQNYLYEDGIDEMDEDDFSEEEELDYDLEYDEEEY